MIIVLALKKGGCVKIDLVEEGRLREFGLETCYLRLAAFRRSGDVLLVFGCILVGGLGWCAAFFRDVLLAFGCISTLR